MKPTAPFGVLLLLVLLLPSEQASGADGQEPLPVSPGSPAGALIEDRCPTFSWGGVPEASGYELVVYRVSGDGEETQQVLNRHVSGAATSWTPSLNRCLERGGHYAWALRAMGDGSKPEAWSETYLFAITGAPSVADVEKALAVLRTYVEAGAGSGTGSAVPEPSGDSRNGSRAGGAAYSGGRLRTQHPSRPRLPPQRPRLSGATDLATSPARYWPPLGVVITDNHVVISSNNGARTLTPALGVYSDEGCSRDAYAPDNAAIVGSACSEDSGLNPIGVLGEATADDLSYPYAMYGVYGRAVYPGGAYGYGVYGEGSEGGVAGHGAYYGVYGASSSAYGHGGHFVNTEMDTGYDESQVGLHVETFWGNLIEGYETMLLAPYRDLRFRVHRSGNVTADGTFTGGGADFAESVVAYRGRGNYEPGTVLEIGEDLPDGTHRFRESTTPYSRKVAGILSTQPGFLGRPSGSEDLETEAEVPMAIVGIVPCRVSAENGPIRRGDLLVTAATPGHAMKATDPQRMIGAVVAKALDELDIGTGRIDVLVSLQ